MKCAYCGANVATPFVGKLKDGRTVQFCDILCGRLYDIIEQPIEPLMHAYNKIYISNRISPSARLLFERFNDYALFKMIPVCSVKEGPEDTKRYYNQLFGI